MVLRHYCVRILEWNKSIPDLMRREMCWGHAWGLRARCREASSLRDLREANVRV